MFKLWRLKRFLHRLDRPALWLSGGKDSRLLLEIMIAERIRFTVLRFDDAWSREQRAVVDELTATHNLRVYSYPPSWSLMVGDGEQNLTLISGYAVSNGGETSAVFRDIVDGQRCSFDVNLDFWKPQNPPVQFAGHVVGTKRGETHWALGGYEFLRQKYWQVGEVEFFAPLFSWSDADVILALRKYGVKWQQPEDRLDTGNIAACTNCLHGAAAYCPKENRPIDPVEWSPQDNLLKWQTANGIEV